MARLNTLVDKKVNEAMKEELAKHRLTEEQNYKLRDTVKMLEGERDHWKNEANRLRDKVADIDNEEGRGSLGNVSMKNAELRKKVNEKDKDIEKLQRHINYIQD